MFQKQLFQFVCFARNNAYFRRVGIQVEQQSCCVEFARFNSFHQRRFLIIIADFQICTKKVQNFYNFDKILIWSSVNRCRSNKNLNQRRKIITNEQILTNNRLVRWCWRLWMQAIRQSKRVLLVKQNAMVSNWCN